MFRLLVIFIGIIVLASGTIKAESALKVPSNTTKEITQKKCPVMGGKINKKLFVDFKGKRIYVCCPGCIEVVKKDPEKYLKKVQEEQKEIEAAKQTEQKTCPVLGGVIVPKLYYTYSKKIYVCCPGCLGTIKKDPEKYLEKVQKEIAASKDKKQKTCPVKGGKINPNLYYEYNKKIYVCCKDCIAKIKKNPDKYLKKMLRKIEEAKKKELKKSAK